MITLITGTPGSGKSLYLVWQLRRELKAGRRLLVNGIKGLALEHELVDDETCRKWQEVARAGDVLVIDEVQRIWPPVTLGSKPTPDVEALHVHRHKGVDVYVVTQHPQRMSKLVRDLVGRHVHVRRMFGMQRAMLYEWDMVHNPGGGYRDAVKTWWRYPRDVFNLYISAEVHTKPKAVIPKALYVFPVALVVAGICAWLGYRHLTAGAVSAGRDKPLPDAAAGAGDVRGAPSAKAGSKVWRVAGRYSVDGVPYVLVTDGGGRFRSVESQGFKGDELQTEGTVDGERTAVWSGSLSGGSGDAMKGARSVGDAK